MFIIHHNTAATVDAMLANRRLITERRWYDQATGVMKAKFSHAAHEKFETL
jgi:hypothetical protein